MSDLSEFLPAVIAKNEDFVEPHIDLLGKKAKGNLLRLEDRRSELEKNGKIATGSTVSILASAYNGYGRFSEREAGEHLLAAENIARLLKNVGIIDVNLVEGANLEDLLQQMRDPEVSDVMFIGHAERSNMILDKTATWRIGEKIDHLKHSIGLIGCSTSYKGTVSPRFGTLLVPQDGLLYGKQEGAAHPSEIRDLGNFYELSHYMSGQQPSDTAIQDVNAA